MCILQISYLGINEIKSKEGYTEKVCGTNGEDEKHIQNFSQKAWR
jgi:hypothetical protein